MHESDTRRPTERQQLVGKPLQEQSEEIGNDPVYTKLWKEANQAEGEIVFNGNTTAAALDKYLTAQIACYERVIEHPNISDEYREVQTQRATANLERYRAILQGSNYAEKPAFCQEQADKLSELAGERTDTFGIEGRKQAASWLKTKADCLEMPPEQQKPIE